MELLACIPEGLPACIVVVLHLAPDHKSYLAEIFQRYSKLIVKQAQNKDPLRAGMVYIAPPNAHVMVVANRLRLSLEPPVDRHRPSIDLLFESIADEFKERGIGVILSGSGDDGSDGFQRPFREGRPLCMRARRATGFGVALGACPLRDPPRRTRPALDARHAPGVLPGE